MNVFAAAAFSWLVMALSEMVPGFAFENRADRALFYMAAWLCAYQLFKKSDK